jgi:uncharacterized protein YsxB (DUF464 family)
MTSASILENDDTFHVSVTGHAGYNPGNDIVCAAISTLTATLGDFFRRLDYKNDTSNVTCLIYTSGEFVLTVKKDYHAEREARAAIDMFLICMESLAAKYPNNVRLEGNYDTLRSNCKSNRS